MKLKLCFVFSEGKGPLRLLFSFLGPKDSFTVILGGGIDEGWGLPDGWCEPDSLLMSEG